MSERTALIVDRNKGIAYGDLARDHTGAWRGVIVRADFDESTLTFRRVGRLAWSWRRVVNTYIAARQAWRNIYEVLP